MVESDTIISQTSTNSIVYNDSITFNTLTSSLSNIWLLYLEPLSKFFEIYPCLLAHISPAVLWCGLLQSHIPVLYLEAC